MGPARRADVSAAPCPGDEEAEEERGRRKRRRRRGGGGADAAARRDRGPPPGGRRRVASALRECLVGGDEEEELVLVKPAVEPVPIKSRRWQLHEAFSFPAVVAAEEDPASDAGAYWEPVVHAFLATERLSSALNGPLTAAALEEEATTASLSVSNRGGSFHSGTRFLRPTPGSDASRGPRTRLRRAVLEAVASADRYEEEAMSDDGDEDDEGDGPECEITSSWANVRCAPRPRRAGVGARRRHALTNTFGAHPTSREGGHHGLHNHENASWSGVYYPCVPPPPTDPTSDPLAGAIVFRLASGERGRCSFSYVRPRPGLLLVFPPWLLHCVMPSPPAAAGGRPRVSIAFNTDER